VLASVFFTYQFGIWGAFVAGSDREPYAAAVPFRMLGQNYPFDVAMLACGAWAMGLALYFILSPDANRNVLPAHVPATSKWAQRLASQGSRSSPMAGMFLVNSLLLATMLFVAYIGARSPGDHARYVSIFGMVAGLQVALGLILLILALFEKPKGPVGLLLGGAVYVAGTAVSVLVFLWGQPQAQP